LCIKKALTNQGAEGRILVLDDEPDIPLTLKAGFETVGLFSLDAFSDPELALQSFKPDFYALVLIDIMMPKMDGFRLYDSLKKVDPAIKVCFLTASEMYYGERRGLEHCALNKNLFLQKPISTEDLVREVNKKINSI
jgi:two-component system catabolic regulation response regulator CreB/two-component system response regulator ChvI